MILNTIFIQSSHTEGIRPPNKSLYEVAIICPPKTGKEGNTLAIDLNPQLKYIDFYSKKEYTVYHSEIKYHVVTDGTLTAKELYIVYEKVIISCIKTYQLAHQHLNSPADKIFQCPPFEYFQSQLEEIVGWFYQT